MKNFADSSIFIVIPAYNEDENLLEIIPRVNKNMSAIASNYKILVVDDGSNDATQNIILNLMKSNQSITSLAPGSIS
jgi:glycosyltransferase involved in cell wall biosynthesis